MPSAVIANLLADQVTIGEETLRRTSVNSTVVGGASGQLRPVFFDCRKTEVTTQVRVYTGGTAAAATPTLCRIGLWTADEDGALLDLVAATANDTSMFSATATAYTRNWATSYQKVAGQRYAVGVLQVSGATVATFVGLSLSYSAIAVTSPVLTTLSAAGLTDLPTSAAASPTGSGAGLLYAEVLP